MRIRYDKALLRLSEYSVKAHRWQITAFEQVAKDIARADGGQLRRISDKDKFRFQRKSFEQMRKQRKVYHRTFVRDDRIVLKLVVLVSVKDVFAVTGRVFEQSMERFCLSARQFGNSFCRTSRRGAERKRNIL